MPILGTDSSQVHVSSQGQAEALMARRSNGNGARHGNSRRSANGRKAKVGFRFSSTVQPKRYGGAVNRKGSKNLQAKLTEAKVRLARQLYKRGAQIKVLARKFGVDPSTMSLAVRRLTFRHVR
jgi:hypothetical protein